MSPTEIAAIAGGMAGLVTALGGIIISLIKIKEEREETTWKIKEAKRDNAAEARREAGEQVDKALKSLSDINAELRRHMLDQSQRITDQGRELVDQSERITDVSYRHGVAVRHLVDRERAIKRHWPARPESVPDVPESIVPDLLLEDPGLRIIYHTRPKIPEDGPNE